MKKKTTGAVSGGMIDALQAARKECDCWDYPKGDWTLSKLQGSGPIPSWSAGVNGPRVYMQGCEHTAALIVRAVNAHAGLVEALSRAEAGAVMNLEELDALTAASGTEDYQEIRSYLVSVRDEARAALRAAGEAA